MRHWINFAELYCFSICNKYCLSMPFSGFYLHNCCLNFEYFGPQTPPKQQKNGKKAKNKTVGIEVLIIIRYVEGLLVMSEVSGYCLKCKTYGPIKNGSLITMANGRTRMAGSCSQENCSGKISKIVS